MQSLQGISIKKICPLSCGYNRNLKVPAGNNKMALRNADKLYRPEA